MHTKKKNVPDKSRFSSNKMLGIRESTQEKSLQKYVHFACNCYIIIIVGNIVVTS